MCGICGFTNASKKDKQTLQSMCDVMAHRGPDGEGQYMDEGIALGHRRLSLIDLEGGNQPMVRATNDPRSTITSPARNLDGGWREGSTSAHATGDYALVFNGEIYNYQDLRAELEQDGWVFQKHSDTEVLLTAYLAWGKDCLTRLRGMFAFALWDRKKRELFCARDFFGIKPFYYTLQGTQFIFASEIKCILEHPAYERVLNHEALEQYLSFQFSALPETFFKGIFKLAPAHCMTVRADGTIETSRYWRPSYDLKNNQTLQESIDAIDTAMQDSVRYHNVADVEVGSFLSSGIDSSYMAASLAHNNPAINTFTVGFAEYEGERDEVSWARELSEKLKLANYSKLISEQEYWDALPLVQWHMDEPSADPSAVALYFVDQEAAKKVKAVLSGEGADEFFGGYKIYQVPCANRQLSWLPSPLLRGLSKLLRTAGLRGANYLTRASQNVEDWYYTNANAVAFSVEERKKLLKKSSTSPRPQAITAPVYAEVANQDETTRMQYVDLHFWLVGDILLKTDKMSMAHSLESRVPFLDKAVWEVARTIPTSQRVSKERTKIALREAALRHIPRDWAEKEKLGFPVPIVKWLRNPQYAQKVREAFTSSAAEEFFNTAELCKLLDAHQSKEHDLSRKIWIIYMFLMWYQIYFVEKQAPCKASK